MRQSELAGKVTALLTPERAKALREAAEATEASARSKAGEAAAFSASLARTPKTAVTEPMTLKAAQTVAAHQATLALQRWLDAAAELGRAQTNEQLALGARPAKASAP